MKQFLKSIEEKIAVTILILVGIFGVAFFIGYIGVIVWFFYKVGAKIFYLLDKLIDKI